jgi:hypothetical protein
MGTKGLTREGPGSADSIHHPYFPTIHDQYCRRNMDDGCCQLFESQACHVCGELAKDNRANMDDGCCQLFENQACHVCCELAKDNRAATNAEN